MKKKYRLFSLGFFLISVFIFSFSIFKNTTYFELISNENVILYQLKQAVSVMVLYIIGYSFLKLVQSKVSDNYVELLAFPCGIAFWVFASMFLLLTDIVYYNHRVYIIMMLVLIIMLSIKKIKKSPFTHRILPNINRVLIVSGCALMVSTGWNYVVMNYDSYLYFANYGKTLTILQEWKAFNTGNAYVLTNIGQFLPLVNSFSAFWGYDYCLPIQTFLILNIIVFWGYAIYEYAITKLEKIKAVKYTLFFVLLVITCTPLIIYSNWLLSNAFLMVYLLILIVISDKIKGEMALDYGLILFGSCLAMTFLRKEGIIIVCFLVICFCCKKLGTTRQLLIIFIPIALLQFYYIYYMRFVIGAWTRTAVGTSILNNTSIVMIAIAVMGTILYIILGQKLIQKFIKHKPYWLLLSLMILGVLGAIALKPLNSIDHIDAILRVMMGSSYGFVLFTWGILICAVFLAKPKLDFEGFLIVGYCMLTFLIYWNKGNTEQGIDNSGMRMFYQIIPVFYYYACKKMVDLLERTFESNNRNANIIIVEPLAGMGNRFLALASAYQLAEKSKKQLAVIWNVDGALGAKCKDILQLPENIKIYETTNLGYKIQPIKRLYSDMVRWWFRTTSDVFYDQNAIADYADQYMDKEVVNHCKLYVMSWKEFTEINNNSKQKFSFIKPNDEVMERGKQVWCNILSHTVGIHIRRTDHADAIQYSPIELFVEKMEAEIKENENTNFFVATDDIKIQDELKRLFGDKVFHYQNKSFSRIGKEGVQDAYIDMLALAKCEKIWASFGSTFSRVAGYIGGKKIEVVQKGEL